MFMQSRRRRRKERMTNLRETKEDHRRWAIEETVFLLVVFGGLALFVLSMWVAK